MLRIWPFRLSALALVPLAIALFVSCSKDSNPTNSGGGNPAPNTISIASFDFTPAGKTIAVGTKITWVNNDNVAHTVTSDNGGFTSSGSLANGQTYEFTFATAGTYPYHCTIHPTMKDTITVTP